MSKFASEVRSTSSPVRGNIDKNNQESDDEGDCLHEYDKDHPYSELLARAKEEAFDDLERTQCIVAGSTNDDTPVLVFIPRLGFEKLNCMSSEDKDRTLKRMLLLFIRTADEIVRRRYILVFAHTALSIMSQQPLVYKYYKMLPRSYKKNVRKLIVLHPTFLIRSFFEVGVRWFVSAKFYRKLFFLDTSVEVQEIVNPYGTVLPAGLLKYEVADKVTSGKAKAEAAGDNKFSAPLDKSFDPTLGTTDFLYRCKRFLISSGALTHHGLFRVPGDGDVADVIRDRLLATTKSPHAIDTVVFPSDKDIDEEDEEGEKQGRGRGEGEKEGRKGKGDPALAVLVIEDTDAAASALKAALRYLPVPVITYDVYEALISATRSSSQTTTGDWDDSVDEILRRMPKAHQDTLHHMLGFLAEVAQQAETNSMPAINLGKIFAASMMRSPESATGQEDTIKALAEAGFTSKLMTRLITRTMMAKEITREGK